MTLPIDSVTLPALIALLVLLCGAYLFAVSQLIARLKIAHRATWILLGHPRAIDSLMARRLEFLSGDELDGLTLNRWIYTSAYLALKDPVLSKLASRSKLLRLLIGLIIAAIAGLYAVRQRR